MDWPDINFRILPTSVEATLRFVVIPHRDRETKDAITRSILSGLNAQGIELGE